MVDACDPSEQMGGPGTASDGDANKGAAAKPVHAGELMTVIQGHQAPTDQAADRPRMWTEGNHIHHHHLSIGMAKQNCKERQASVTIARKAHNEQKKTSEPANPKKGNTKNGGKPPTGKASSTRTAKKRKAAEISDDLGDDDFQVPKENSAVQPEGTQTGSRKRPSAAKPQGF
eukprot:jgi/Ulvmu1/6286/UM028_0147.1